MEAADEESLSFMHKGFGVKESYLYSTYYTATNRHENRVFIGHDTKGQRHRYSLNNVWVPARMEMGMDDRWCLVGLPGLTLDGLEVRQGWAGGHP